MVWLTNWYSCVFSQNYAVCLRFSIEVSLTQIHICGIVHKVIITVDTEVVDVAWAWLGGVGSSPGHIPAHDIIKHGGTDQIYEKTPKSQCCSSVSRHLFGLTGDSMNNLLFAKSTWKCEYMILLLLLFFFIVHAWLFLGCVRIDYRVYRLNCYTKHSILLARQSKNAYLILKNTCDFYLGTF